MERQILCFNSRMEDSRDILTFKQITDRLLSLPNCAIRDGGDYYQNLHGYVHLRIEIVQGEQNPKLSTQCRMIKENCLYLLKNYDRFKKGAVNTKIKK